MKYQLSILVPADVFDEDAAAEFIDLLGRLTAKPDRILVIDHAKGGLGGDRLRRERLKAEQAKSDATGRAYWKTLPKTRHGHMEPTFEPLRVLHSLADEVRCSNDHMTGDAELWYASHRYKKYSIQQAVGAGMDAVMLVKFPHIFHIRTPEAMLKYLDENQDCSWCYPPVLHTDTPGSNPGRVKISTQPGRATELRPENKIIEHGTMIRLAGLDMDAIASIQAGQEPIIVLDELLKIGYGQGVRSMAGEAIWYLCARGSAAKEVAAKPPGDPVRDRLVARAIQKK